MKWTHLNLMLLIFPIKIIYIYLLEGEVLMVGSMYFFECSILDICYYIYQCFFSSQIEDWLVLVLLYCCSTPFKFSHIHKVSDAWTTKWVRFIVVYSPLIGIVVSTKMTTYLWKYKQGVTPRSYRFQKFVSTFGRPSPCPIHTHTHTHTSISLFNY